MSHPADAEDVLQDIFVKLLGSGGPNEATQLLPWVFTVARNRIIDFYRERARLRVASVGLVEAGGAAADETSVDLGGALEVLMARLSGQDREVLRAVDLEGLSQKEYADSLGLNYATAKSRVQRARKRLRREFERCCTVVLDRRRAPLECTPRHQSVCGEAC